MSCISEPKFDIELRHLSRLETPISNPPYPTNSTLHCENRGVSQNYRRSTTTKAPPSPTLVARTSNLSVYTVLFPDTTVLNIREGTVYLTALAQHDYVACFGNAGFRCGTSTVFTRYTTVFELVGDLCWEWSIQYPCLHSCILQHSTDKVQLSEI